jgi:carbamoyl-phosphate synthase large subunit
MAQHVVVTGAGGPAGVCAIRALVRSGHLVTAADADPHAVGLRLAHRRAVVPRCDAAGFVEAICALGEPGGDTVLLSTVAEELVVLGGHRGALEAAGLRSWMPAPESVASCVDKWRFHERLAAGGVPTPVTALGTGAGVPGPWIVKPRFGRGSRDVFAADDPADLAVLLRRAPQPIVQQRIEGAEFTVDVLVDDDGEPACVAPRWRLETKAGIATRSLTFHDSALDALVARAMHALGLVGPVNLQGFRRPDGSFVVIEVNPRLSGGLALTQHAGADIVGEFVRRALGAPLDRSRLRTCAGVLMMRHHEEVFERCG